MMMTICMWCVDTYNHRVQKFTIRGEYLHEFGNRGNDQGQLDCPLGITIHENRVYVADQCNYRVSVFQCNGKFSDIIPSPQLRSAPYDVVVNNSNQLLVAVRSMHCIFIFTFDGGYVGKFGKEGSDKGQLLNPTGIAVDKNDNILVIEGGNHRVFILEGGNYRVSIFNEEGVFIHCFGSKGSAKGQFLTDEALGIALSRDGRILISDYSNQRIQIYSDY